MSTRTIEIRILRWNPGAIDPARFESFRVSAEEGATVLDVRGFFADIRPRLGLPAAPREIAPFTTPNPQTLNTPPP